MNLFTQNVKNSWRIVNHRDIIPTIPRMIGYYHVAQPIYLAPGNSKNALVLILYKYYLSSILMVENCIYMFYVGREVWILMKMNTKVT